MEAGEIDEVASELDGVAVELEDGEVAVGIFEKNVLPEHDARQAVLGVPEGQYLIAGRNMGKLQTPQHPARASWVG